MSGTSRARSAKASTSSIPIPSDVAMKRVAATSGAARVKTEYPAEGIKKVSSATTAVRARRAALGELQSNKENLASRSGNVGGDSKADVKKAIAAPSRPAHLTRRSTRQVSETAGGDAPVEDVKRPVLDRRATSTKNVTSHQDATARPRAARTATTEKLVTTTTNIPKRAGLKRTHTATSVTETKTTKPPALSKNRLERDEQDDHDHEPSSKRQRTSSPGRLEDTDVEGNAAPKKLFSRRLAATKEHDEVLDEEPMIDPASDVSETNGRDPRVVADMDADDAEDPTMVLEYQEDIFEYMRDLEVSCSWYGLANGN